MESNKRILRLADGDVTCVDSYDKQWGNVISVFDSNGKYLGGIYGCLADYTDYELCKTWANRSRS